MKKALKIVGIIVLVLIIALISAPFLFKDSIEKQVKKAINDNLEAQVEWSDLSLSLLSSFPDARLKLNDLSLINKAPFEGDTLVAAKTVFLDVGLLQLLKGGDHPLSVNEIGLNEALVNVKVNKEGAANYDIAKSSEDENDLEEGEEEALSLDIKKYQIKNSRINYLDESSELFLRLKDFNHQGSGDFSAATSTLKTKTKTQISFAMGETSYFNNTALDLTADIKMDLEQMKFSFEDNKALINQLPLSFDGYVQVNDDNQEIDLSFATPSSDFKNFLGLIPEEYIAGFDQVETSGNFSVDGKIYGVNDDKHIPKMNISLKSTDAYFKFPDLPKAVEHINFDAVLVNETGLMKDMNMSLPQLNFQVDQDKFSANGEFKDLTGNILVDLAAKGRLNLANINKAYPIEGDLGLDGILDADMKASFAMDDIEKERYEKVKSNGSASLSNFNYDSDEMANPINISKASLSFNPGSVSLKEFDMTTGQTDAHLNGTLHNLMGFLFKDQPIKGNFELTSQKFSVNDFMVKSSEEDTETSKEEKEKQETEGDEEIKIPSFLDVVLNFKADEVEYDNLSFKNMRGSLKIQDEKASLDHITAAIFGGTIGLNGSVSTKTETPKFDVNLELDKIGITQSLQEMELLKSLAPIAQAFVGDLTTKIDLNGDLTKDFSPIYSSLSGSGLAEIIDAVVEKDKLSFVSTLNDKLNFMNMDEVKLKNIVTHFEFKDGGVNFKPFDFTLSKDIKAEVKGRHTFDNKVDYVMDLEVPAKYLGKDLAGQLSKLSDSDMEDMTVELPVNFAGSIAKPQINVNVQDAVKDLSKAIVDKQKDKVKDEVKDKAGDALDKLFGKDKGKEADTTEATKEKKKESKKSKEDDLKDKAKGALEGLFGKDKKK